MNHHAANDTDSRSHHELLSQMGQLGHRERVLIGENDQLRAQLVEMKQQENKKYDDLIVQYYNIKREYRENDGLDNDGTSTNTNYVTVKTESIDDDEDVKMQIKREIKEEEDYHDDDFGCDRCLVEKELVSDDEQMDNEGGMIQGGEYNEIDSERHEVIQPNVVDCERDRIQLGDARDCARVVNRIERKVKQEIEEEIEMELKNVMDKAPKTNEQIVDCVKREIKEEEEEDGQMMHIKKEVQDGETNEVKLEIKEEEEDGETQINDIEGSAEDNQSGEDEAQSVENAPTDTTPAHPIGQPQPISKQSTRVAKRKQTREEQMPNEENNRDLEVDDAGEGTSGSVKRSRPTIPTSNEEKQIITVTLRCPQSACGKMIDKDQFNQHLMIHSIGPFRCPVKDCGESFDNRYILRNHIPQSHQDTIEWHCNYCDHHFPSYRDLSHHNSKLHQLGHFECSFPACTFTGEYRGKVYDHYAHTHKNTEKTLNCQQVGCNYQTGDGYKMKRHQQRHLGIKPYRCKWSGCDFAATEKSDTIRHIKRHLKSNSSTVPIGEPGDYVEVVHE